MASTAYPNASARRWPDAAQPRRRGPGKSGGLCAQRAASRTKWILAGLLALLLVAAGIVSMPAAAPPGAAVHVEAPAAASQVNSLHAVRVEAGDTIWQLAVTYGPQGQDVRQTVWQLKELNGLSESGLRVGQVIWVPAAGATRGDWAAAAALTGAQAGR